MQHCQYNYDVQLNRFSETHSHRYEKDINLLLMMSRKREREEFYLYA